MAKRSLFDRWTSQLPLYGSHHSGRFGCEKPSLLSRDGYRTGAAVAGRLACPQRFPCAVRWRREKRLRSRIQNIAFSKIYQQQTIVVGVRKISEHEACRTQNRAIDTFRF